MPEAGEGVTTGAASYVSMRSRAIRAVQSPLGFFVLALLIVEAFLLGAGTWFGLSGEWKIAAIATGVVLFLIVFVTVVWLVVKHPKNLVFSEESQLQFAAMQMFGSENNRMTGLDLEALQPETTPTPAGGQLQAPSGEADKC